MVSIAPGRAHWYDMPAHWYAGQRSGKRSAYDKPTTGEDPERAARRSKRLAIEAAGWLWINSRPCYVDTQFGNTVPFRQAFWTMTVPEPMPEDAARRALSSYWTWARNVAGVSSYLWVGELTKRGRVHFHALVNQWIDVDASRSAWHRALMREGCGKSYDKPPANLCHVEAVSSAGKARGYVTKYVGKDFGDRKSQLISNYLKGHRGEDGYDIAHREEIRSRLVDTIARPLAVRRRWGATQDLERKPLQVNGAEDPNTIKRVYRELKDLPGTRWGENTDTGRPCYYDLDQVTRHSAPVLFGLLHQ